MSILPKISEYQDGMSTASYNKIGIEELEGRQGLNAAIDVLNAAWISWTPTLAWTTVAKYTQVGRNVYFKFQTVIPTESGTATTDLTVTLPVTPAEDDTYPALSALQLTNTTYTDPQAYIDMTTGTAASRFIKFRKYTTTVAGTGVATYIQGIYQVA
jgi:hypothetical protein